MDVDEEKKDAEKDKKKEEEKKEEPNFELVKNPARVMRPQLKVIQLEDTDKYKSLKDISIGGNLSHFSLLMDYLDC
jgi:26S proteasome regulatory subunit N2